MRKYKVGDVIKFKDLSDINVGDFGIPQHILETISNQSNQIITEVDYAWKDTDLICFQIDCSILGIDTGWWFRISYIDESSLMTPQQKQHILQLIREI